MFLPYVKLQHKPLVFQQRMPIKEQDDKDQRQPEPHTGNGFERHKAMDQFVCVVDGVPAHKH